MNRCFPCCQDEELPIAELTTGVCVLEMGLALESSSNFSGEPGGEEELDPFPEEPDNLGTGLRQLELTLDCSEPTDNEESQERANQKFAESSCEEQLAEELTGVSLQDYNVKRQWTPSSGDEVSIQEQLAQVLTGGSLENLEIKRQLSPPSPSEDDVDVLSTPDQTLPQASQERARQGLGETSCALTGSSLEDLNSMHQLSQLGYSGSMTFSGSRTLAQEAAKRKRSETSYDAGQKFLSGGTSRPSSDSRILTALGLRDDVVRATSLTNILSRGGKILKNSAGSADTYLLSKPRQHIDCFISHNWSVPRWKKFWALTLYYNIGYAVVAAYICVGIGCVLNMFSVPPTFQGSTMPMRVHCLTLGSCGFWMTLMFGHDIPLLKRLCCRQPQVFLDKICIHQTDPDLKAAGINNLGAFLRYSKKMLVLFNTVYCERLWTVYEFACYTYLHSRDQLQLLPVDIPSVVLKSTALITLMEFLTVVIGHIATTFMIGDTVSLVAPFVIGAVLITTVAFILRSWALQESELFSGIKSFRVAKAACAEEGDRVVVSSNICAFVRSMRLAREDGSDVDALEAFDKLVQERMPELLRSAIGTVGFPYKYALVAGIGQDFYALDELTSTTDAEPLEVSARLVSNLVLRAALMPSVFLVCAKLSKAFAPRKGWAELRVKCGIALAACFSEACLFESTLLFRSAAMHSIRWLIAFATCGLVLTLVVIKLFSWKPSAPPAVEC